ncbi:MAG: N-acetylmuramoyl-L-alanine amidase [Endomicrobiia bacterium]|nr:N-acetylmuramoyl-L-alanine amidase [Endomicrobiia bacterium]
MLTALILTCAARPLFSKNRALFIYEGAAQYEAGLAEISRLKYIPFSDVAKVYRLSLSFRPVSGKISVSAFNRRADFVINSDRYNVGGVAKRMRNPARVLRGKAYISADFLMSSDFGDFTETETLYYPDTVTYVVSVRHNIFPARFYSREDGTKIMIETKEILSPSRKLSAGRLILEYPRGKLIEESLAVDDGVVREIRHSNKGRMAIVEIFLTENAATPSVETSDDGAASIFIPRAMITPRVETSTAPSELEAAALAPQAEPSSSQNDDVSISTGLTLTSAAAPLAARPKAATSIRAASPRITTPKIRIVLDAGHGGEDPGAVGPNGTLEKDINLAVVLELQKLFSNDESIETILTRADDTFIPLVERTNLANEKNSDIFISVHCNASMKRSGGGYEVYFLSETASDPDAMATQILENSVVELEKKKDRKRTKLQELLWSMIVNEFINESSELCYLTTLEVPKRLKVENRGVKQAGFYVLRGAQMPAILVECAFLSNPSEEAKLRNPRAQKQIADGVYVAIKNYLRRKGRIE